LGGTSVIELADARHDATAMRYRRFADTDPEMPVEIFPPSPEAARISRSLIQSAFALMEKGDPPLASEIRALLREIILAAGSKAPDALTFDGISSFMFWGAIIINADRSRGELEMVQMLAHESAHNLLFGLSADEPLLDNSAEERYPSPLRADPRPLEGIYHATFVTARMHRAVRRLVESHVLSPRLEEEARRQLEIHSRGFAQGMEVIEQHARLTAPGEAIIQGARVYMARG
jgi:HEXXH motif-containing protein